MANDNDQFGQETLRAALKAARKGQFSPEMQDAVKEATKGMSRTQRRTSLPEAELRRVVSDVADFGLHVKKLHPGLEMATKDFEALAKKMQQLTNVRTFMQASGAQMPLSASRALQASQFKFTKYADQQRIFSAQREAEQRARVNKPNEPESPEPDEPDEKKGGFSPWGFAAKGAHHSSFLKTFGANRVMGNALSMMGEEGALGGVGSKLAGLGATAAVLIAIPAIISKSIDVQKNLSEKYSAAGDFFADIAKTSRFGSQPGATNIGDMRGMHRDALETYLPTMRDIPAMNKLIANSGIPVKGPQGYNLAATIQQAKQQGAGGLGGLEDSDYLGMLKPLLRYGGASLGQGNAIATPALQALQKAFGKAMADSGYLMFDKSETAKMMADSLETLAGHGVVSPGLPSGVYSRMESAHGTLPGLGNPREAASVIQSLSNAGESIFDNPALLTMTAMYAKQHGGLKALAKKDPKLRSVLTLLNKQAGGRASDGMLLTGAAQTGALNPYLVAAIQGTLGKGQFTSQAIKGILGTTFQQAVGLNSGTGILSRGGAGVDDRTRTVKRMLDEINNPNARYAPGQFLNDVSSMGFGRDAASIQKVVSLMRANKGSKDYNSLVDTMTTMVSTESNQGVAGTTAIPQLNDIVKQMSANSNLDLQMSTNWQAATGRFETAVTAFNKAVNAFIGKTIPQGFGHAGK